MRALAFTALTACALPPPPARSSPPACGTDEHAQMAAALDAYCAGPRDDRACGGLARAFAACDVDLRDAAGLAYPEYPDGLLAAYVPAGMGYWQGAVFQWKDGAWIVAGIVGGDIK